MAYRRPPKRSRSWKPFSIIAVILALVGLVAVFASPNLQDIIQATIGGQSGSGNAFLATPRARPTVRPATNIGADVGSVSATSQPSDLAPLPTEATSGGPYAFLLMGYGGGNHPGAYLTDSLMLVIVDPTKKTLALLSIPRDSWVPIAFSANDVVYNKVNTAYALAQDQTQFTDRLPRYTGNQGPGTFAADTISRLVGVPVRYYLGLDFDGFRQMIDAVGGVDVNVPDSFTARYPVNDDPSINAAWMNVSFTKGMEHMNGARAIEFARAREVIDNPNEGTDFARSRRQRLIMEAFKTRIFQPGGMIHLPQLLAIASQHADTNYSIPGVASLARLALSWKDVTIYQTALTTANYLQDGTGPDGTYITVPSDPTHSWAQIRAFTRHLWSNPAAGVAMANTTVRVVNANGVGGLAGRVSASLLKLGYQVDDPITGPVQAQTRIVDRTGGKATPLIKALEHDLGLNAVPVVSEAPDPTSPFGTSGIVLELGSDQADLAVSVPTDTAAPYSTVGVIKFGVWPYTPPPPTPVLVPTRIVRPTPRPIEVRPLPTPTSTSDSSTTTTQSGDSSIVAVPSLIGLSEADAQSLINRSGLMTTYVNYQTSKDVADRRYFESIAPGHVLSQSPAPGEKVPRGTRVVIAVRKS